MKKKETHNQPLTLEMLMEYNNKIFLPELKEIFADKKDFNILKNETKKLETSVNIIKIDVKDIKVDTNSLKSSFSEFKNQTATNFDKVLKKLDILITEKEVKKFQREKDKQLWLIFIQALKEHDILSKKHLQRIAELDIF